MGRAGRTSAKKAQRGKGVKGTQAALHDTQRKHFQQSLHKLRVAANGVGRKKEKKTIGRKRSCDERPIITPKAAREVALLSLSVLLILPFPSLDAYGALVRIGPAPDPQARRP